jgi:hypothetical protein
MWLRVVLVSATLAVAAPAGATTQQCVASHARFQQLRDEGRLLEARAELSVCGASSCPEAVQRECAEAMDALEARIPTVVLVARDAEKRDVPSVAVSLDGKPWKVALDGREAPLDPGWHTLRFVDPSGRAVEQRLLVHEREKGRFVTVDFAATPTAPAPPPPPPRPEERTREVPTLVYVLGAIGGVGLGVSTYFGVSGLSARSEANACGSACTERQIDVVNQRFLAADIALGLGVAAIGAAVWMYLAR